MGANGPESIAVLLLAGGLKSPPLEDETRSSVLALHAAPDTTLLDCWLGAMEGVSSHPVRLLVRSDAAHPPQAKAGRVEIVRDIGLYRGPAGAIRDVAQSLEPGVELLLICEAFRVPSVRIGALLDAHTSGGHDITLTRNTDGSSGGIYLIRRAMVDELVPAVGFLDLKEQFLGKAISGGHDVRVVDLDPPGVPSARTLDEFIDGVCPHCDPLGRVPQSDEILPEFSVVSAGVVLGPGARVWRSIIMDGATVSDGCTIVRSLLLPGATVKPGETVVDAVVGG